MQSFNNSICTPPCSVSTLLASSVEKMASKRIFDVPNLSLTASMTLVIALQCFTDYLKWHYFHELNILFLVLLVSTGPSSIILQSPVITVILLSKKQRVIYSRLAIIIISVSESWMSRYLYASIVSHLKIKGKLCF